MTQHEIEATAKLCAMFDHFRGHLDDFAQAEMNQNV